jgi:hypothetical protein
VTRYTYIRIGFLLAGFVLFVAICLQLALVMGADIDLMPFFMAGWSIVALGVGATILLVMLYRRRHRNAVGSKIDALQGAAWELIKLMENSGPGGPEARSERAEATTERFAVTGAAAVGRRPLAVWREVDPKLTDAGLRLMDLYKADSAKFRKGRGAVRNALVIFLAIVRDRNLQSAYALMVEHMMAQRDEHAAGSRSLPNFSNLKIFLDLPTEWPTGDLPEQMRGQSFYEYLTSSVAVQRLGDEVMNGLEYRTLDSLGSDPIIVADAEILKAMREFIRSDNTRRAFS